MIETVLFTAVKAVTDALTLPVKWPNTNGPVQADTWLDVVLIPTGEAKSGWNDLEADQGLLNLGVNVNPNTGRVAATACLDALKAKFAQGVRFFDTSGQYVVECYAAPRPGQPFESGQKTVYPLQVRYRSFRL